MGPARGITWRISPCDADDDASFADVLADYKQRIRPADTLLLHRVIAVGRDNRNGLPVMTANRLPAMLSSMFIQAAMSLPSASAIANALRLRRDNV